MATLADKSRQDFLSEIEKQLGQDSLVQTSADLMFYETDHRGLHHDKALCAVLPRTTEQVALTVKLCQLYGLKIVPQGGNTGLTGGSTPVSAHADGSPVGDQVVISLSRLNQIEEIDLEANCMRVGAGVILQKIHEEAEKHQRFFPLKLGAWGSCQIGGNISTNAGGINVLAYGNTRALVLGIEAVLPDGQIFSDLSKLRKDNTGFDLKQLFIGGEGLLGIVTHAVIKLFPLASQKVTLFTALESPDAGLKVLNHLQNNAPGLLTSAELIPRQLVELAPRAIHSLKLPLEPSSPWYLLTEHSFFGEQNEQSQNQDQIAGIYATLLEQGLLFNAALAQSETQGQAFWQIREATTPVQALLGASIKHDVSVPLSAVPSLINSASQDIIRAVPGCRPLPFGHLGDGNLHFNISQGEKQDPKGFRAQTGLINQIMHDHVVALGGSISAEHGIGRLRRSELARLKDPISLNLMRSIKNSLDPNGLFNPGKVL